MSDEEEGRKSNCCGLHPARSGYMGVLWLLSGPVAMSVESTPGEWRAYHFLMTAWLSLAVLATGISWLAVPWEKWSRQTAIAIHWANAFLVLSVLLALRGFTSDPMTPWWSFGVTVGASLTAALLAFRRQSYAYSYASMALLPVAVTMVWAEVWPVGRLQGVRQGRPGLPQVPQ